MKSPNKLITSFVVLLAALIALFVLNRQIAGSLEQEKPVIRYALLNERGVLLTGPVDMVAAGGSLVVIDSGTVYEADLKALEKEDGQEGESRKEEEEEGGSSIRLTPLLSQGMVIEGHPIASPVALAYVKVFQRLYVLDQSGSLYSRKDGLFPWRRETPAFSKYRSPAPLLVNMAPAVDGSLYLLDLARNQIWRLTEDGLSKGLLPGRLPYELRPGEADLTDAVDLTVGKGIYVLFRDGRVESFPPPASIKSNAPIETKDPIDSKDLLEVRGEAQAPGITNSSPRTEGTGVYVLLRDGELMRYRPAPEGTGGNVNSLELVESTSPEPSEPLPLRETPSPQPVAITYDNAHGALYVVDTGGRSLSVYAELKKSAAKDALQGNLLYSIDAGDNVDFSSFTAVIGLKGKLLMLAGGALYSLDLNALGSPELPLAAATPGFAKPDTEGLSFESLRPNDPRPNDPRVVPMLRGFGFKSPLGAALGLKEFLPIRGVLYPGARRAYRYGVHEGLDLARDARGRPLKKGAPVFAIGDGVVTRADIAYKEMGLDAVRSMLAEAKKARVTPDDVLQKLHGRRIIIKHAGGVFSSYSHLSSIEAGIEAGVRVSQGQRIGAVGVSGTPSGISGTNNFPHLHFEVRLGESRPGSHGGKYYLGQWLGYEMARYAYTQVFSGGPKPLKPSLSASPK